MPLSHDFWKKVRLCKTKFVIAAIINVVAILILWLPWSSVEHDTLFTIHNSQSQILIIKKPDPVYSAILNAEIHQSQFSLT